jgi:hypothetical protein
MARNLSVEGMLLEIEGGCTLGIGDGVMLSVQSALGSFEVPSVVLHCNANCMGLMFHKPQPQLYRLIVHSSRHARAPISSRVLLSSDVTMGGPRR